MFYKKHFVYCESQENIFLKSFHSYIGLEFAFYIILSPTLSTAGGFSRACQWQNLASEVGKQTHTTKSWLLKSFCNSGFRKIKVLIQ